MVKSAAMSIIFSPDDVAYCNAMLERHGYWRPNSLLVEWLQTSHLSIQQALRFGNDEPRVERDCQSGFLQFLVAI